ncbi:unnamed protein product [Prunus brigantina]
MTSEAPESTSPITITEIEHAVRISASDPITTDRTAESVQEQAVMEDLMDKQAYRIETSFMAAMDRFSSELRTLFQERIPFSRISFVRVPHERGMTMQVSSAEITDEVETAEADWHDPIINTEDIKVIMTKSHKGICDAYQSSVKMRWLVRRHGYYWPSILKNCIEYAKGCIKCQIYGPIQRVLAEALHPVTKPWPFRGWAVDIIGKIYPAASNQHAWILVATDYFTKWVKAESYRSISSTQVVRFFENHIVHRFGIPETITADNGPVFASAETREYAERIGIKLVHSTPYYPQSNGQAEASKSRASPRK